MKIIIYNVIFLCLLMGCKKIDADGYTTYKIKEGNHKSTYRYNTTQSNFITFSVIFDSSAIYQTQNPINQLDVNKLYGVSDCGCNHMKYSMRVGWRWVDNTLELLWYRHKNGNFDFDIITTIPLNTPVTCSITLTGDIYEVCVDGVCKTIIRPCEEDYKKYYLYPYFGGNEKAPHDIKISLKQF